MLFFTSKIFLLVLIIGYVSAAMPTGYIVHHASGKLIHPASEYHNPYDNTPLVVLEGGFGLSRLLMQFVADPQFIGYGYIRHVLSGKYVCPSGGSLQPADNTELVLFTGACASCLFSFDVYNDFIIHQTSQKIWHPAGGFCNPADKTNVVLHPARHVGATFIFANAEGMKLFPASPIGHIVHHLSSKIIHPQRGFIVPADDTRLLIHEGGLGEDRLMLQFRRLDAVNPQYGYFLHYTSGKYVCPQGGSLQPADGTPLVFHTGKHPTCLFAIDAEINEFIVHINSQKNWYPSEGSEPVSDTTYVVLVNDQIENAKFFYSDACGRKVNP